MTELNRRDVLCALALLLLVGAFTFASFEIREPDYGTLSPATWPRVILAYLALLSAIYLVQSLRAPAPAQGAGDESRFSVSAFLARYRNPLWCYALFATFLLLMPVLGMLLAGILFVFSVMTALGGVRPADMARHAIIASVMVGAMWALFTYGLGVLLPSGSLFSDF